MSPPPLKSSSPESVWEVLFVAGFGLVLGISLLKFGNPIVLNDAVIAPQNRIEFIIQPWPVEWGYVLLAGLVGLGLKVGKFQTAAPTWIVALPAAWFGWQLLSGAQSIRPDLTRATLLHFGACVACFYLGVFALAKVERLRLFWLFLGTSLAVVLVQGWQQHFGGLEETRKYVLEQMADKPISPQFLAKIQSNRIFSTLVYPNALAGVIILLLPAVVGAAWFGGRELPPTVRVGLAAGLAAAGVACLYWTGSKGGWLIAVVMLLVALGRTRVSPRVKLGVAVAVAMLGLVGFGLRFQGYFAKGATSVGARFEYWRAAAKTFLANPILGTGPGTFSAAYQRIKPPEAEMARLAHNDFLQQASDSGVVGAVAFAAFFLVSIVLLYRNSFVRDSLFAFLVWLGLAGWALQSCLEFGLYVPAIAWPGFVLFGWLWGKSAEGNQIDTPATAR